MCCSPAHRLLDSGRTQAQDHPVRGRMRAWGALRGGQSLAHRRPRVCKRQAWHLLEDGRSWILTPHSVRQSHVGKHQGSPRAEESWT